MATVAETWWRQTRLDLADRVHAWRNRLLADPRFHRFASAFPPTRGIARRKGAALFDLCAGFVYSQILFACVRLRLFEVLAEGPATVPALARRLSLTVEATDRLLAAAASLGLAARRGGGRYGLGELGAALLGNPGIAEMIEHHAMLYADLSDPLALLRGEARETRLGRFWAYAGAAAPADSGERDVASYTRLMAASQPLLAEDVLDAYDVSRHRRILDVGGGDGTFLTAVAARAPDARLMLFDLPAVAERARARFATGPLAGRAEAFGGDFRAAPLPGGADLVTLVRVAHDHDDESVAVLLAAARAALAPGGTVMIAEPMAGTPGAERIGDAYFGFYLLAMGSGRARSPQVLGGFLERAGFCDVRSLPTRRPFLAGIVTAVSDNSSVRLD